MIRTFIACVCVVSSLLISSPGRAADYLKQSYDLSLITTFMVLDYDACVKQGFIEDDGRPSAAQRFQVAIDESRTDSSNLPSGVTSEQVADAMQKALDAGRAATAKQPLKTDQQKCDSLKEHWPKFAKQSGLE